jgi:uncharacterized membrane protein
MPTIALGLALAYPLLTHAAVWLRLPFLQWLALCALLAIALLEPLVRLRAWAWLALCAIGAALYALVRFGGGVYALYLPPVLLPAALLGVFAASLRPGAIPLVTRFATAIDGPLPPPLAAYTRQVTLCWVAVLALLAGSGAVCALFAPPMVWSVMTNFVHYIILGGMFLLEYLYRHWRFRELKRAGFISYLRQLVALRIRPW